MFAALRQTNLTVGDPGFVSTYSSPYQCVVCGTPHHNPKAGPNCGVCLSECPAVEGVAIRVAHAVAKLRSTVGAHRRYFQKLNYAREQWATLLSSASSTRRHHAERAIVAQSALLGLSDDISTPMERCLSGLSPQHWLDDVLSLDGSNAWDIDHMLPYFYQDWHNSGDFQVMRDRIHAAVARHGTAATRLLVVGAGACGLVRDLATSGFEVHALDLSLPCLVLANRLLRGHTVEVTIPHKFEQDWRHVALPGAAPFARPPHVSVANAARLPIQNGTFHIV